jgi:HK97 family phage portal protein
VGVLAGRPLWGPTDGRRAAAARELWGITRPEDLIPPRPGLSTRQQPNVTADIAMRHSAVWAAKDLRAGLISTMPVEVFRTVSGVEVGWPSPPVLINPGGERVGMGEWMYSSQQDLDGLGNCFGLITATDGNGFPARIELQAAIGVTVRIKDGKLWKYRIGNTDYNPDEVWHEKQYTIGGCHVGLSPIAYAAWSIGEYLSVQQFAIDWFSGGAIPRALLKNTAKKLVPGPESGVVKEAWNASIAAGEPAVLGADWEYSMVSASAASADWIQAKQYSVTDVARFMRVPADVIDAAPTGTTRGIQYQNITQANLQFLILHLQPPVTRRETALSSLLARPRYVRLNTKTLLRMDPVTVASMIQTQINARVLTPDEARLEGNRPPLDEADYQQFDRLFGAATTGPDTSAGDVPSEPDVVPVGELPQ